MVLSLSWSQPDVIEAKTADYEVVMDFSRVLRLFELYKQDDIDVSEKLFRICGRRHSVWYLISQ